MARTEAEQLVHSLAAEAGRQRTQLVTYLVGRGCQICGEPAVEVAYGPEVEIEVVREAPLLFDGVTFRLTEQLRIRCVLHKTPLLKPIEVPSGE